MLVNGVDFRSEVQTAKVVILGRINVTFHVVKISDQRVDITSELFNGVGYGGVCDPRQDVRLLLVDTSVQRAGEIG